MSTHRVSPPLFAPAAVAARQSISSRWEASLSVVQLVPLYQGKWYCYLSNELDVKCLPTAYLLALYWQRWRTEMAHLELYPTTCVT